VEFVVDLFEAGLVDVGVDLSGGDAGVAEHLLDLAQVGSAHEQVGCETVPQRVRTDRSWDTDP
jgi:hypothetical protein